MINAAFGQAIAVVIPCFNLGRTLEQALDSVRRQSRAPTEVVVIDDGSTDLYTRRVLARLDPSVQLISTPNQGPATARNLGIRLTTASLIVLLDADDLLDPTYLEKAAGVLETRSDLSFVSCAIAAFGQISYEWMPPPCTIVETITRGGVHISTMFRRELWEAVGGFDSTLPAYEDTDFWLSALEHGFQGEILEEPLLRYRVRRGSRYHQALAWNTYRQAKEAIFRKHNESVTNHGREIFTSLLGFRQDMEAHQQHLVQDRLRHEQKLVALQKQVEAITTLLRQRGHEPFDWGEFQRRTPFSPPIAKSGQAGEENMYQYYARAFLARYSADQDGRVVEINEIKSHANENNFANKNSLDCVVLHDCLRQEYDVRAALAGWQARLRPGGVLLATCSSIHAPPDGANQTSPDYWRFTEASVRALFAEFFPPETIEVSVFGNLISCVAALYGVSPSELEPDLLEYQDPCFPLMVCARAVKRHAPKPWAFHHIREQNQAWTEAVSRPTVETGAILLYHRIASLPTDVHGMCVSPDEFRYQMDHLRRHYVPIALEDLALAAREGRIPRRAVAVTFDDGYLDNYDVASPILLEMGVPATFFLNTERFEEEHEAWWDVVERILISDAQVPHTLTVIAQGQRLEYAMATGKERYATLMALHGRLLHMGLEERKGMVQQLREWSSIADELARPTHRLMTADEAYQLSRRPGHSIGAHTTHHLLLPAHPRLIQLQEMVENKDRLEQVIGRPIVAFSYPYGAYNVETEGLVQHASFKCAVTVEDEYVRNGMNPLRLPRLEMKSGHMERFEWRLRQRLVIG